MTQVAFLYEEEENKILERGNQKNAKLQSDDMHFNLILQMYLHVVYGSKSNSGAGSND